MADLSSSVEAIRNAVDAVFSCSPAPPTTEDVAAAVLRAAADRIEHHWDGAECVDHLQSLATELEGHG